ncbi:hypothetical protein HD597_000810 [Nonomuraea thailandensis]|uniref:Uncharacterized protein n=1 Tax=Nonomuraea thailandensis TaxID=1188745 RepID=A0A9X2G9N4_9ACTN|nr:hypothetical protein [Nonomuraea thailandensis]MCP2353790.1 hypothetical protein [Nonomuraea thailandensis]
MLTDLGQVGRWLEDTGLTVGQLDREWMAQFRSARHEAGQRRIPGPRAMVPLLTYLVVADLAGWHPSNMRVSLSRLRGKGRAGAAVSSRGEVWRLMRQDDLIGEITIEDADGPWLSGRFVAGPAFPDLEPLFQQELALLDTLDEEYERWETIYDKITRVVRLVAPHGPVAGFLLHVQDGEAWFRWSNESFAEE